MSRKKLRSLILIFREEGSGVRSTLFTGVIHRKVGPDFPGEAFRLLKEKERKQYDKYRTRHEQGRILEESRKEMSWVKNL